MRFYLISIFGLKGVAIASAISIALGLTAVAIFDERSKHEIIKLWLLPFRYLSPKNVDYISNTVDEIIRNLI